ncbi:MAG: A/G-specific adenine glycosylase [Chloroflexales bacterium]
MTTSPDAVALQARLLAWFAANARDLPWRHTRDPYAILVSEIMLQQTQVERVIPKYLAFLTTFPTLAALANAPTAEVIRMWAGLGYNRRAVNLQRAARAVLEAHAGVFPREVAALLRLPGVGPYTAGAVACFAFEQDVAFIDTNIRRVLRRARVGPDQHAPAPAERELLALGAALVPSGQGWVWNQALMELGALICTAAAPSCHRCPIMAVCRANATWRTEEAALVLAMGANFAPAPARVVRRVAERRTEPYQGSRRWFRGRLVDALRALPSDVTMPLADLGPLVKADFQPTDLPWLHELVTALAHDGLVRLEDDHVRLP